MSSRARIPDVVQGAVNGLDEFNRRHPWSHNDFFHPWILRNLPGRREFAVDVGCGQGKLAASLAPRFTQVIAMDTSPQMRATAAQRCAKLPNVSVTDGGRIPDGADLITMIAVLHHLDVDEALSEVAERLAPGGRFLCVGLAPLAGLRDLCWDVAAMVTTPVIGLIKSPKAQQVPQTDSFPVKDPTVPFAHIRTILRKAMPGAQIRHRLAFRHTISWTKP
ncbi:class I SAM-dependent methyltransferase [Cumulibacter soli]|uniref:class I SAM-dependent methyltransferase n=1 Tax=Cumulibacter soli TaxID=2546344 RepID=UPI001ABAA9DA|nr:class I SAM-dependent methyltransferase [Cumulibacter soli]